MQLKEVDLDKFGTYEQLIHLKEKALNGVEALEGLIASLIMAILFFLDQKIGAFSKSGELLPSFWVWVEWLVDQQPIPRDTIVSYL